MANIRKAEDTQTIAELKQEISVLKMKVRFEIRYDLYRFI